jgi:hypothetical protein
MILKGAAKECKHAMKSTCAEIKESLLAWGWEGSTEKFV